MRLFQPPKTEALLITFPMTTTAIASVLGILGVAAVVPVVDATDSPWWIAAIVVPLAGFAAWLVRYILEQQKQRDAIVSAREEKREAREELRAEQATVQTRAMQQCVDELRALNAAQVAARQAIEDIPDRVVQQLQQRKLA